MATGAIKRIDTTSDGTVVGGYHDWIPRFSPDGTKVAFNTLDGRAYVKDLDTDSLTLVSSGTGSYQLSSFTPDGRDLIVTSSDSRLVGDDTNGTFDVFRVWAGQTTSGVVQDRADQPSVGTSGMLSLTDADVGDTHTVTVKPADGTVGNLTAKVVNEPGTGPGTGAIAWEYTVDHTAVATLEEGKTKVEIFTITVDDGHGGTAAQDVTITVRGSAPPAAAQSDQTGSGSPVQPSAYTAHVVSQYQAHV